MPVFPTKVSLFEALVKNRRMKKLCFLRLAEQRIPTESSSFAVSQLSVSCTKALGPLHQFTTEVGSEATAGQAVERTLWGWGKEVKQATRLHFHPMNSLCRHVLSPLCPEMLR